MIAKEEFINSSQPATKGDLEQLREDLQADMAQMEERLVERIEGSIDSVEERMNRKFEAILGVSEDTNEKLDHLIKQVDGVPERVTVLEDDVLKLKAKVR